MDERTNTKTRQTMTPKEKADELVERFRMNVLDYEGCSINTHKAKQCALIAVDELVILGMWTDESIGKYWQEVKQEIEKL
jgi:hypothetical protein